MKQRPWESSTPIGCSISRYNRKIEIVIQLTMYTICSAWLSKQKCERICKIYLVAYREHILIHFPRSLLMICDNRTSGDTVRENVIWIWTWTYGARLTSSAIQYSRVFSWCYETLRSRVMSHAGEWKLLYPKLAHGQATSIAYTVKVRVKRLNSLSWNILSRHWYVLRCIQLTDVVNRYF